MLQTVHDEFTAPRASSLHCVWIPPQQESGPPLVVLWIDDEMRAFGLDCIPKASAGEPGEVCDEQAQ
jgi:hypothetical protein